MMNLDIIDYEKIGLLDKLFSSMDLEQLKSFIESEEVVARLKGSEKDTRVLSAILRDQTALRADLEIAQIDIKRLQTDMVALVRCLNSSIYGYNQTFQDLKQRNNIY